MNTIMVEDAALLRKFVEENSEAAFRDFVDRWFNFVYAAALRQVGGDSHLARDVAQNVFIDVAKKARILALRPIVAGWLHTSTRFAASSALRARSRRIDHEQKAQAMHEILAASSAVEPTWHEIRPVLDQALGELGEPDREAILLRFFENLTFTAVGASLDLGENAARMRVERALEKLRARLAQRGITSTTAALAVALANQPLVSAPAGMVAAVAGASLASAAAAGGSGVTAALWALKFMNTSKLALIGIGMIAALGLGGFWGLQHQAAGRPAFDSSRFDSLSSTLEKLQIENRRLNDELAHHAESPLTLTDATLKRESSPTLTPLDRLRILIDLQQRKLVNPAITFLDQKGKLNSAFVDLFALTPSEQERLQQTVDDAHQKLRNLERTNSHVTQDPNGNVTVAIQTFPIEGGKAYDEMIKGFASVLGQDRNDAFLQLGASQVEKALGSFGESQRTLVFTYDPSPVAKDAYTVNDTMVTPNAADPVKTSGMTRSITNSHYKSFNALADKLGAVVDLLPPEFNRGK